MVLIARRKIMVEVYITAKLPTVASKILDQAGISYEVFDGPGLIDKAELLKHVGEIKALITPLSTKVDQEIIDHAPNLKIITNFGAGYNNIDVKYAREKGIPVTNTPFVSSVATAEIAAGLAVALSRRIVEGDRLMRSKGFAGWAPLFFLGHELAGKTLGIVGLGDIGKQVAKRLKAFDMNILYYQRHRDEKSEDEFDATFVDFETLVKTSDIISLHVPLTPETHHLFDEAQFKLMKNSALLINCARGPVINEKALLIALRNKEIAGAALDVYENEPNVTEGLTDLDNVILTPHIGNASVEARDKMAKIVADNVVKTLQGQQAKNIVN